MITQELVWHDINQTRPPRNREIMFGGKGKTFWGKVDDHGQLRGVHNHPLDREPTHWAVIPRPYGDC